MGPAESHGNASPRDPGTIAGRFASRAFDNLEEIISSIALVIVVLSACWGVITRYFTHQPATWTSEMATIAFAWVVFVGASAGFKRGSHISIDMLVAFLPARLNVMIQSAIDLLVLIFCSAVSVIAVNASIVNWDSPTSVLRLPTSTIYIAIAFGFAMMVLRHGRVAWGRWRDSRASKG